MPQLLQHIDAIAREKDRDVLFVSFEEYEHEQPEASCNQAREALQLWLEQKGIAFGPCMGMEQPGVIAGYSGDLYIDVPYDEANPTYQILRDHLEDEDGNMKIEGVLFFALSLDIALEIEAERDDYWGEEEDFDDQVEEIDSRFDDENDQPPKFS